MARGLESHHSPEVTKGQLRPLFPRDSSAPVILFVTRSAGPGRVLRITPPPYRGARSDVRDAPWTYETPTTGRFPLPTDRRDLDRWPQPISPSATMGFEEPGDIPAP